VAEATRPGAASTIEPAELKQSDPIGVQETITSEPGVYGVADDGMGQTRMSVGIRGLQPRRTQRVLVMEDGMPIQPAPYVFSPLYYNPPVERIEEVEITKGHSSIRYGPQTMAGVINYVTSRPQRRSLGGELKVTGGSHRYTSAFGEVGGFGTEDIRPQVQFLFKRGDGFRQNNDFLQLNGTAKLKYDIDDDQSLYLKSNVDYERLNATYTGLTPHTFDTNPDFNPKDDDFYRIFRASLGAIYNQSYNDRVQGTTRLYANVFDRPWWRENDVFARADEYANKGAAADPVSENTPGPLVRVGVTNVTNPGPDEAEGFGNERTFYVTGLEHSLNIDHSLFGQSANLETGVRLHYERFEDNRKITKDISAREGFFFCDTVSGSGIDKKYVSCGVPPGPGDDPVTIVGRSRIYETRALSLHALEDLQVGPLRLSPGMRLEVFNQSSTDRLNGNRKAEQTNVVPLPSLGFNLGLGRYDLGGSFGQGQFNLFGGVHRGYTPPSSATFLTLGANDPDREQAFDLRAEKSWNSELGIRGRSGAGQFQLTGFHLYVEDLVGGRTAFQKNLGVVRSYGLEAQTTIEGGAFAGPLPTLDVSYTYLQTEVVEGIVTSAITGAPADINGNELPAAPPHKATVGLSKTLSAIGLTLRTTLRYQGDFYTDLENLERTSNRGEVGPVPSHTVLDAGATYEYSDALRFNLNVKNVTDNVFIGSRLHSNPRSRSASGSTGILPGPRRQINLSVQYNF
jgi:Fe(3+) dicitrate transport protein